MNKQPMAKGRRPWSQYGGNALVFLIVLPLALCKAASDSSKLLKLQDAVVPINLYELLGPQSYAHGVSWQPLGCYAPTVQFMGNVSQERLSERLMGLADMMVEDLRVAFSQATGLPLESVSRSSSFPEALYGEKVFTHLRGAGGEGGGTALRRAMRKASGDPRLWAWARAASLVALRYTVLGLGEAGGAGAGAFLMACPERRVTALLGGRVAAVPGLDCSPLNQTANSQPSTASTANRQPPTAAEQLLLGVAGLFPDAAMGLAAIAKTVLHEPGWCGVSQQYDPYGAWLKKDRLLNRHQRQRFVTDSAHKDRLMLLFDLLYETEHAFRGQRWLGSVSQQNPFDMYAIMDIIHTVKPQLIVETGTANGGSALTWASALELGGVEGGRVITVDPVPPAQAGAWAGDKLGDPTQQRLWSKYVLYLQGSSTDDAVLFRIQQAASAALGGGGGVLVLLDSDHTTRHVHDEMVRLCPLVSVGSYCIVQDTKLSRYNAGGGPAPAIAAFLSAAPPAGGRGRFKADRAREPFYTQHPGGYLQRLPEGGAQAGTA